MGLGQSFNLRFEPLYDKGEIAKGDTAAGPNAVGGQESSFDKMLVDAVDRVNQEQVDANEKVEQFIRGENVSTHDVMIQLAKADTTMRLMTAVTNKVVDAYREISRMQV